MGLRILYDARQDHAALYCSTSDWAFGPVFYGNREIYALERAEAFIRWLPNFSPQEKEIGPLGYRNADPRTLTEQGVERAYGEWLAQEQAQYKAEEQREREAAP